MTGRARQSWIAGLVVGVTGGFLALEFPTLGWLILALFAVPAAIVESRAAAIGGLLAGLGACWLVILGRVAITCRASGEEPGCQAPGIEPWLALSAVVLTIGIALTIYASARARRGRQKPLSPLM
jgi:hypothetical protein